jgi:hypothetical protein
MPASYLQQNPPKKPILDNGALRWVARQGTTGSAIGDALLSVRTVPNNVFHGGKFPDGMAIDPLRDEHSQSSKDCLNCHSRKMSPTSSDRTYRDMGDDFSEPEKTVGLASGKSQLQSRMPRPHKRGPGTLAEGSRNP